MRLCEKIKIFNLKISCVCLINLCTFAYILHIVNQSIMKTKLLILFVLLLLTTSVCANDVVWFDGYHPVTYQLQGKVDPVVKIALQMFTEDMQMVTGQKAVASNKATIIIRQGKGSDDGFKICITPHEQSGRGMPSMAALITLLNVFLDRYFV